MTPIEHWRLKAEETRAIAEEMRSPAAKRMLEQVAKNYERLADAEVPHTRDVGK